jgi:hypothetical protein
MVSGMGKAHGQDCADRGYPLSKRADLRLISPELALCLQPVPDLVARVGAAFEVDIIGTVPQVGLRKGRLPLLDLPSGRKRSPLSRRCLAFHEWHILYH